MAGNYTPDEIQRIFEEYNNAIKNGTPITGRLAKEFKDAQKGVKDYTDRLNASIQQLGRTGITFARSLKDGKLGASTYNDAIGSAADVVSNVASQFGILGAVFGTLIKAGSEYAKAVNKQSDALYDAYQEMGKIGVTGSEGVTGVFKKMQKLGYGIEELGLMTDLLAENGETLQAMGGTATQGAEAFANLASSIQRDGIATKLQRMGMSVNDINKGAAAYMRQEMLLGGDRNMSAEMLKQQTVEYLYQQDKYAKLTGKSVEQVQEALEAAMKQEAFNQTMYELKQEAQAGDASAQAQMDKLKEIMASNLPKDIKDELTRAIGGDFSAAEKLAKIAPDALKLAMDRKASTADVMNSIADGMEKNLELRGSQAKINTYKSDYGDPTEQRKFLAQLRRPGGYLELEKSAVKNQEVTDKVTETATDIQIANRNTRDGLQSMLQKGVEPLTKAVSGMAKGIGAVVQAPAAVVPALKPAAGAPIGAKAAPAVPPPTKPTAPPAVAKPPAEAAPPKVGGMEEARAMVIRHEGIRTRPYKDSLGLWTVGVGHLIGDGKTLPPDMNREFSQKEVMDLFEKDFAHHVAIAEQTPGYGKANAGGKAAFIDLAFNMGKWWPKWPTTSKALAAGDFKAAAAGLQDSNWYKQVKGRAAEIVALVAQAGSDKGYKDGGVPTGPESGYQTTLHGTEAIVPMQQNNKMPIDVAQLSEGIKARGALFEQNLTKINDLVRLMSKNSDITQKILQTAH